MIKIIPCSIRNISIFCQAKRLSINPVRTMGTIFGYYAFFFTLDLYPVADGVSQFEDVTNGGLYF